MDIYFDLGSPYAYLAWARIQRFPDRYPKASWHAVSLAHIVRQEGGKINALLPNQLAYNTQDVPRIADALGIPFVWPASFPCNSLTAMRVHHLLEGPRQEAWRKGCLVAHFVEGEDISDPVTLADLADFVGVAEELKRADDGKQALIDATSKAYAAGAPGVPYFVIDGEGFWGQDRMEWVEAAANGGVPDFTRTLGSIAPQ